MSTLSITTSDRTVPVGPGDGPVTVGRDPSSTVVVHGARVSRLHLTVNHGDAGWVVENVSSQGTFNQDGGVVERLELSSTVILHIGAPNGPAISFAPAGTGYTETAAVAGLPADTTALGDVALRLEVDGTEHLFMPGDVATVGRDPLSSVPLGESHSLVSRRHVQFSWDDGRWNMEDLDSTRGTWLSGRKVTGSQPIQGAFYVTLGDAEAGTQIRVTTAGRYKPPRRLGPLLAGGGAVLGVAIALVAVILSQGSSSDAPNTDAQLSRARQATVMVELLDENLNRIGFRGSGVLIDQGGLVLTNAHIGYAASHAERLGLTPSYPDAPLFAIGFASIDGGEVDRFYVAEAVALHPFHDAALLRIIADGNNHPDFDIPFSALVLGSSSGLKAGDRIDQLGFPGIAATLRVSVTTRNFQSFAPCTDALDDDCLADLSDGWLNLSGQPLGGGSSGGPIVRNGLVVGLNQGTVFAGDRTVEQNRAIPIDVVVAELPVE